MKKSLLITLITLTGLWFLFNRAKLALQRLTYQIAGIEQINLAGRAGAVFLLQISNPTSAAAYLKNLTIAGNVILNNVATLGSVEAYINDMLGPGQSITVPIHFNFFESLPRVTVVAAAALLQSGGAMLQFDGKAISSNIEFPLQIEKRLI